MTAANRRGFLAPHKTTTGLKSAPTSLNVGFVSRKRIGCAADSVNAGRIAKKKRANGANGKGRMNRADSFALQSDPRTTVQEKTPC